MIHGYHLVLPHYGFWLPNDPRGSWSTFVGSWELARFGTTTRHLEQRTVSQLTEEETQQRKLLQQSLKYPPVQLTGEQALCVADGFKEKAGLSAYEIWACAEQIANMLKGAATRRLRSKSQHPLSRHVANGARPPAMWARRQWIACLDSDTAIENAIAYVDDNPIKEGKPRQEWSWLSPYRGLGSAWTTYL